MTNQENADPAKAGIVKINNISKSQLISQPDNTILVYGTIAGKVSCKNIKAWRAQKAVVQSRNKIVILKEIIGSDFEVELEKLDFDQQDLNSLPNTELMLLVAPEITIGKDGEKSSASKNIIFVAEKVNFINLTILKNVTVVLGQRLHSYKDKHQDKPIKLANRTNMLKKDIEADMEDFEIKSRRPGNEAAQPVFKLLNELLKKDPNNNAMIIEVLKKQISALKIVNMAEICGRWQEKFDSEIELKTINLKLEKLYKKLCKISLNLSLDEIKPGGALTIVYGDDQHVIKGPLANKTLLIDLKLVDDPETGYKKSDLDIKEY